MPTIVQWIVGYLIGTYCTVAAAKFLYGKDYFLDKEEKVTSDIFIYTIFWPVMVPLLLITTGHSLLFQYVPSLPDMKQRIRDKRKELTKDPLEAYFEEAK